MKENAITKIEKMIFTLRGQRVMLDSNLAELYGIETKALNQAVKRNKERFPEDFMFECNSSDLADLRSQIVTANSLTDWNFKRRSPPMVFTEYGVSMLSSVLNSAQAIQINISIVRTFIRLRSFLSMETEVRNEVKELKVNTTKLFKAVFERLDDLEEQSRPSLNPKRKKIGLKD